MRFRFDLEGSKVLMDFLTGEQYRALHARMATVIHA